MIEYRLYDNEKQGKVIDKINTLMRRQGMMRVVMEPICDCPQQTTFNGETMECMRQGYHAHNRIVTEKELSTPREMLRLVYDKPDEIVTDRDLL